MKTLFFGLWLIALPAVAAPSAPHDPYLAFPWRSVNLGSLPEVRFMRTATPPLTTFRQILLPGPAFAAVLSQCGMPAKECAYASIPSDQPVPRYRGGRLYRYNLPHGHVYIWTDQNHGVPLAIYRSTAGTGELLYK